MNNFRTNRPFGTKPPRLKDLVNQHVLRAVDKCIKELSIEPKFGLNQNFIKNR